MQKTLICLLSISDVLLFGQDIPFGQEFLFNNPDNGVYIKEGWYQTGFGRPGLASLSEGGFIACWENFSWDGLNNNINGQIFNKFIEGNGGEFQANTNSDKWQLFPEVSGLTNRGFIVVWESIRNNGWDSDIHGQVFDESGEKRNSEFRVNTFTEGEQLFPNVATLIGGGYVACWVSDQPIGEYWGAYGQMFDDSGEKKNGEFCIVKGMNVVGRRKPSVAALSDGGFVVCWENIETISGVNVKGQMFDRFGEKRSTEFLVSADVKYYEGTPRVAGLTGGGFVVCWIVWDGYHYSIRGQVFNESGGKIKSEFTIFGLYGKEQGGEKEEEPILFRANRREYCPLELSVAGLKEGGFIVCWDNYDDYLTNSEIFGQLFDESGEKKYEIFKITRIPGNSKTGPNVSGLHDGGFVICWYHWGRDNSNRWQNVDVYGKCFPSSPLKHSLKPFMLIAPSNDSISNSADVQLSWHQASDLIVCYEYELHYRIYIDDGPDFLSPQIIEQNQDTVAVVTRLTPGTTYFWKVLAKNISGDSLWSATTNGFFVSRDALPSDAETERQNTPKIFRLLPNYPNPFNSSTTIQFELPVSAKVEISIVDVSGKRVETLIGESSQAGSYSVKWDGRDSSRNLIPSGIYVCRMEVRSADGERFIQSMKMGLVR